MSAPSAVPGATATPVAQDVTPVTASESDRLARLALSHAVEPADSLIGRILARHSPEEVLDAVYADRLADLESDPIRRERLADRCTGLRLRLEPGRVEAGIAAAEAVGARFIVPDDQDWPRQLDDLGEQRPIGIWAIGRWPPSPASTAAAITADKNASDISAASTSTSGISLADTIAAGGSAADAHASDISGAGTIAVGASAADSSAGGTRASDISAVGMSTAGAIVTDSGAADAGVSGVRAAGTSAVGTSASDISTVAMISVVGARACTGYGSYIAGAIGADLASAGFPVVSGAALGIDAAAHRGAIAVGGPTIAVLACGIDRVYPRVHEVLLRTIAERGAVLSELPPGAAPTRFRFLHRNRIIAALGIGTVVVEAARRSGSLVTARLTAELGRVVMAVPGPVTSDQSAGVHELIRDGATLVTDAGQVREACSSLTVASLIAREATRLDKRSGAKRAVAAPAEPAEPIDPIEQLVAEALPTSRAPSGADVLTLARIAGLPPDSVFAALGRLAASGRAVRSGGGWMLAAPE